MLTPAGPLTYRGKRIVRVLGLLLLSGCGVMLVGGLTVWRSELEGMLYLLYWSWCFLLAVLTGILAALDAWLVHRASRRERRELFKDQFQPR